MSKETGKAQVNSIQKAEMRNHPKTNIFWLFVLKLRFQWTAEVNLENIYRKWTPWKSDFDQCSRGGVVMEVVWAVLAEATKIMREKPPHSLRKEKVRAKNSKSCIYKEQVWHWTMVVATALNVCKVKRAQHNYFSFALRKKRESK